MKGIGKQGNKGEIERKVLQSLGVQLPAQILNWPLARELIINY